VKDWGTFFRRELLLKTALNGEPGDGKKAGRRTSAVAQKNRQSYEVTPRWKERKSEGEKKASGEDETWTPSAVTSQCRGTRGSKRKKVTRGKGTTRKKGRSPPGTHQADHYPDDSTGRGGKKGEKKEIREGGNLSAKRSRPELWLRGH